jgi:hypothetical protein
MDDLGKGVGEGIGDLGGCASSALVSLVLAALVVLALIA